MLVRRFIVLLLAAVGLIGLHRAALASPPATAYVPLEQLASVPRGNESKTADYVFIEKSKRRLSVWRDGWLVRSFPVRLGRTPVGQKERQGDGKTPEGLYSIDFRKPDSNYHLALHLSYPSNEDRARASRKGVDPGGSIMIHGLPDAADPEAAKRIHRYVDWTEGCIAVTNAEIEELWKLVPSGTPVEIVP